MLWKFKDDRKYVAIEATLTKIKVLCKCFWFGVFVVVIVVFR